jgi:signal peptidase I
MVHFDFEVLLLVLTLVTGAIWLVDVLLFARMRRASTAKKPPNEPLVIEYSRAFFPVLAIVLVLRAFAYEPFRIPSGSMMPSLLVGDFILVNKYSYGFRLPVSVSTEAPARSAVTLWCFVTPRISHRITSNAS